MSEWSPEFDALVAAPGHHTLLLENEQVRVLDTCIQPGDTVPMHTHQWPAAMYVLSFSHFIRRDHESKVLLDTREAGLNLKPGQVLWGSALDLHTLENVGDQPLRVISTEIKKIESAVVS